MRSIGRLLAKPPPALSADKKRPPEFKSVPYFGPIMAVGRRPYDLFTQGAQSCGPIFRMTVMGKTINVVTGSEVKGLVKNAETIGLTRKFIFAPFVWVTDVDIFGAQGEEHKTLRRLVLFGFGRSTIAPFVPHMARRVRELVRGWPKEFLLQPKMAELAIEAVAACVSPKPLDFDLTAFGETTELGFTITMNRSTGLSLAGAILPKLMQPSFLRRLPRILTSVSSARRAMNALLAEHQDGLTDGDPLPWMIDALKAGEVNGQTLDDAGVRGSVFYALMASYIYLGRQTLFMLTEATRDPQTLRALKTEVDTVMASGGLTAKSLKRMPTLRAVFVEASRRYPLLPGMPYTTTREIDIGGYTIGPDEVVMLSQLPGHFDGSNYKCPWAFDADRVRAPRNEHKTKGAYAPWGVAPRSCAAVGLCELVATTIVATIVHELDLELPNPSMPAALKAAPLVGPEDEQPVRILRWRRDEDRSIDHSVLRYERFHINPAAESLELPDFEARHYAAGDDIVVQGEEADDFYIILDGTVAVLQTTDDITVEVATLGPGQSFGERGLLKQEVRNATIRAQGPLKVLALERQTFLDLVLGADLDAEELAERLRQEFVSRSLQKSLSGVRANHVSSIGDVQFVSVPEQDWLIRQGDPPDHAYVVVSGEFEVIRNIGEELVNIATLQPGDIFGEIGVWANRPRMASVRATVEGSVAVLTREQLESLAQNSNQAETGLRLLIANRVMQALEQLP
jgi:CRP-like cAMP-binding protein